MRSVLVGIACTVLSLAIGRSSRAGEPPQFEAHPHPHQFRGRFAPVGGWNPYGGGLFHWWNPNCFPRPCGPDDYNCKPLPRVCFPSPPPNQVPQPPAQHTR
jgi:hypothetical protein